MLTIPASIQNLFKTDGTRKNFRVHFPNGEFSDITNDNIVRESVHFTESLCSQDVFKFGLAEASVIEFETVGIGNMYGMTIECSYEIDISSLSAGDISAIEADPGDGVLVKAADSDIGYGFYRVPLGTFRVESCPRNHGAMTHRKATAYSATITNQWALSPLEIQKEANPSGSPVYTFDVKSFLYGNLGYFTPSILDWAYTQSSVATTTQSGTVHISALSDPTTEIQIAYQRRRATLPSSTTDLYSFKTGGIELSALKAWIEENIESSGLTGRFEAKAIERITSANYYYPYFAGVGVSFTTVGFRDDVPAFYPYIYNAGTPGINDPYIELPTSLTATFIVHGQTVDTFSATASDTPEVYKLSPVSADTPIMISVENTGVSGKNYSFTDSVPFVDLLNGYLEVHAQFAKADRSGGISFDTLDNSSPLSITPGNYEECWWDEYNVSPIGTVRCSFAEEAQEQVVDITVGTGDSFYDMSGNFVISSIRGATQSSVETLLSTTFMPNIADMGFTPTDLTMQGWPWMEAGDALEITAEDGTVVDTYALRIEMNGIQHLTAAIQSQGGEIIGEV